MYNRYIPNGNSYTRVVEQESSPSPAPPPQKQQTSPPAPQPLPTYHHNAQQTNKKNAGLAGILEAFRLDDLDSGDILLVLILLFLFRDGDDMELLITLALILLIGLGDKQKNADRQDTAGV